MDVLDILPRRVQRELIQLDGALQEIRLRAGEAPQTILPDGETRRLGCGALTPDELWRITEAAAGGSLYSCESQLRRGWLSLPGGARLGICGCVNVENGFVRSYSEISSLCLRLPHEAIGCAEKLGELYEENFVSTLIISPPGGGKTTLLRELVRLLSSGGLRVGLADERGEVAAVWGGVPQLGVGENTDVITGAPKAQAAMTLLRCMNPQVIALDEITEEADLAACVSACGCGVMLLATAHGDSPAQLRRRPLYAGLLDRKIFSRCVTIRRERGGRVYEVSGLD
ncbi:MAG: stage III sporulation protein AB [Candidatus Heteroscillospira sp.]|jgi:stage III sporulation protein AA